jgi:hypothetical protein
MGGERWDEGKEGAKNYGSFHSLFEDWRGI